MLLNSFISIIYFLVKLPNMKKIAITQLRIQTTLAMEIGNLSTYKDWAKLNSKYIREDNETI